VQVEHITKEFILFFVETPPTFAVIPLSPFFSDAQFFINYCLSLSKKRYLWEDLQNFY